MREAVHTLIRMLHHLRPAFPSGKARITLVVTEGRGLILWEKGEGAIALPFSAPEGETGGWQMDAGAFLRALHTLPDRNAWRLDPKKPLVVAGEARLHLEAQQVDAPGERMAAYDRLRRMAQAHLPRIPYNLLKAMARVSFAAAKEEARPALTFVHGCAHEGRAYVLATDGYRLAAQPVEEAPVGALAPARLVARLMRVVSPDDDLIGGILPEEGMALIQKGEVQIRLSVDPVQNYEWVKYLKPPSSATVLRIHREILEDLLRRARKAGADLIGFIPSAGRVVLARRWSQGRDESRWQMEETVTFLSGAHTQATAFNPQFLEEAIRASGQGARGSEGVIRLLLPGAEEQPAYLWLEGQEMMHVIMPLQWKPQDQ